jgi:adenylate cyclase class IV
MNMNQYLEFELKFDAQDITAKQFLNAVKKEFKSKIKILKGVDTYFSSKNEVLRFRRTNENQELTVKKRHSNKSTKVRTEINMQLPLMNQEKTVKLLLKTIGYKELFTLNKSYFITKFPLHGTSPGEAEVVWYKVATKGKKPKYFIEIEVRDTKTKKEAIKELAYLEARLKIALPSLLKSSPMNKSLYEIYK